MFQLPCSERKFHSHPTVPPGRLIDLILLGTIMYHCALLGTGLYSSQYQQPDFWPFSVPSSTKLFPWILYTWMCHYQAVQGRTKPCSALYHLVVAHSGIQDSWKMLGTTWYWDRTKLRQLVPRRVLGSAWQYQTEHDSTKWYEIVIYGMNWYVQAHTGMYQ
jgi:hypothetical protein